MRNQQDEHTIRRVITSAGYRVIRSQLSESATSFSNECVLVVEHNGRAERFLATIPLGSDTAKVEAIAKELLPQIKKMVDLDDIATDLVEAGVVMSEKPCNSKMAFDPTESKVVTLKGQEFKHDEPRQDVIDMLKDMLERAESGELRSIVAVGDLSDGHLLKAFGGQPEQVMPLYAELTVAWHEFRERYIQS